MIGIVAQVAITILGAGAVLLAALKNRWAFPAGLAAQPAWFYIAWASEQWGILAVAVVYRANWAFGIWNWFFRKSTGRASAVDVGQLPACSCAAAP